MSHQTPQMHTMSVQMMSFYFHSEHEICEILKYYKVNYVENAFIFKPVDMFVPPEFIEPDVDYVCSTAYVFPFKIQCSSCFTFVYDKSVFCDVVFAHVHNERGVKMNSLVQQFSENDRIVVLNGSFSKIFGVDHLFILPHIKNISVFHFKFNENPLFPNRIEDIRFKLSDTEMYSLFGRVTMIKKNIDENNMHLMIQCFGYQNNAIYIYKPKHFSQKEIMCMEKCNCFPDLIDVIVNEPSMDFNLLIPDQIIQLNNVKANHVTSQKMYSLYVKGEPENLSIVSKNTTSPNQNQNIIPDKSNSISEENESQGTKTPTHFQTTCDSSPKPLPE